MRRIKAVADAALEWLSPEFDRTYAQVERASVPPERLLKASLLIALYSVRSERAFCEKLEYNLPMVPGLAGQTQSRVGRVNRGGEGPVRDVGRARLTRNKFAGD